jgi:precorrin-2/cobalt-factor-2 C20-methyltransferase
MTDDEARIMASLKENAAVIAPAARTGCAVFGILGDPNFFSTFSRLCAVMAEEYPDVECRTEPGISAITAFAAAANVSLASGFTVSDGGMPDTRILLKVKRPKERAEELKKEGFHEFVLVERMFFPDMRVDRNGNLPDQSDYLSVMYARR